MAASYAAAISVTAATSSGTEPLSVTMDLSRPVHFVRPYYAFHRNVSIGFGLWAGYPFAYPYTFHNPYLRLLLSVLLEQSLPSLLWFGECRRLRVTFRRGA